MRSVQRCLSLRLRFWLMTADAASRMICGRSVVAARASIVRRLREVVLEVEDVAKVGAAPFVDRLIRIADDAEVAMHLPPDAE